MCMLLEGLNAHKICTESTPDSQKLAIPASSVNHIYVLESFEANHMYYK